MVAGALLQPLGAATVLLVGYFLLPINHDSEWNQLGLAVGVLLLAAFCAWEIRRLTRTRHPVAGALETLTAVVGFYLVVFATAYFLLSDYAHASFTERLNRVDALYFALTVFTTTGFGDITAAGEGARIAVSVQMVSTLFVVGLGVRLMSLLVSDRLRAGRSST
ncbi:potassium channel family protein [Gordonia humi]